MESPEILRFSFRNRFQQCLEFSHLLGVFVSQVGCLADIRGQYPVPSGQESGTANLGMPIFDFPPGFTRSYAVGTLFNRGLASGFP